MNSDLNKQTLDDIVFSTRERSYGSYYLRKRYVKYLLVSFSIAIGMVLIICLGSLFESYRRLHALQEMRPYVLFEPQKNAINELSQNVIPPPPPPAKLHDDEVNIKIVEDE